MKKEGEINKQRKKEKDKRRKNNEMKLDGVLYYDDQEELL
jgi:hypothetical protein